MSAAENGRGGPDDGHVGAGLGEPDDGLVATGLGGPDDGLGRPDGELVAAGNDLGRPDDSR